MEKQIFKVGDKVFDIRFGWGCVKGVAMLNGVYCPSYPILVHFDETEDKTYTNDGKYRKDDLMPTLSFTEYTLQGFSQERPINWSEYEGRWCMFWDKPRSSFYACKAIYKLKSYDEEEMYPFNTTLDVRFRFCQPLSEAVIKELNLEN